MKDKMDRRTFQQLGNKSPTVRQAVLGCLGVVLVIMLPSLTSYKSQSPGRNLRGTSRLDPNRTIWDFKIIADLDTKSKVAENKKGLWHSILMSGTLVKDASTGQFSVRWGPEYKLTSAHNEAGRGMELSELVNFNRKLYTVDDRTGIVFEVTEEPKVVPRWIIMEGDGMTDKGMKHEWATVKDGKMYLGSFGKEFTNKDGQVINTNNLWVTTVDEEGHVGRQDWTEHYEKLRRSLGAARPGYVIHEAATWSDAKRKWVFLPRRVSALPYDEELDEKMGSNKVVIASENFDQIEVREVGKITPERGFSSFKFVPNTGDDLVLALKSIEEAATGIQATYITLFSLKGDVLMEETLVPKPFKFEGLEFDATS